MIFRAMKIILLSEDDILAEQHIETKLPLKLLKLPVIVETVTLIV